jgi:hypothetical protein
MHLFLPRFTEQTFLRIVIKKRIIDKSHEGVVKAATQKYKIRLEGCRKSELNVQKERYFQLKGKLVINDKKKIR